MPGRARRRGNSVITSLDQEEFRCERLRESRPTIGEIAADASHASCTGTMALTSCTAGAARTNRTQTR